MLADLLVDSLVLCVIGNKQFLSLFEALWMSISADSFPENNW